MGVGQGLVNKYVGETMLCSPVIPRMWRFPPDFCGYVCVCFCCLPLRMHSSVPFLYLVEPSQNIWTHKTSPKHAFACTYSSFCLRLFLKADDPSDHPTCHNPTCQPKHAHFTRVYCLNFILKHISQLGWLFPIYGKIKKCIKMFQTTNQLCMSS